MKYRRLFSLIICLMLAAFLGGCGLFGGGKESSASVSEADSDPEYPVDAGGIRMESRPGRVVSLAPALTEKLFDLGVDDRLVGVSDYCDYPGRVTELPACGTTQLPDADAIAALAPHVVLTESALPTETMDALAALDIPVAVFQHAGSVEELISGYRDLARLMEGATTGGMIGAALESDIYGRLDALRDTLTAYTAENGRKKVLYLRLLNFVVATGDTFEHELFGIACMDNIAADYTGWLYPDDAANAGEGIAAFDSLDAIFMDEAFVTIRDLERNTFYRTLPATLEDRYLYVDSLLLERQSIRTVDELYRMANYLYPEAGLPGGEPQPEAQEPEARIAGDSEEYDAPVNP